MMDEFMKRVNAANNKYIGDEEDSSVASQEAAEAPSAPQPVDVYYERAKARQEASQGAKTNGSPASMKQDAQKVVDRLTTEYKVKRAEYDRLIDAGEEKKAQYVADNYMESSFLPSVEALTAAYGPDAVLVNRDVLGMLDDVAISRNGRGDGYTASFIRSMDSDERGQVGSQSDSEVVNTIRKIRQLNRRQDIRSAVGMAENLKKRIDAGELSASDDDYALLERAVNR